MIYKFGNFLMLHKNIETEIILFYLNNDEFLILIQKDYIALDYYSYKKQSCPISFEPLTLKSSLNYDKNTFDISIESSNPISVDMFQRFT
ncbi:hypothetical protein Mgra_00004529 [Meloidogyne graminicola]|uniref:Uncharacterized protein n=1 Tax=Meloidogyne graminicola TaxID=189291 RepID=A0A8S9ZSB4_9BILA|nr:hypothetical protein Mgra_00004529 [Meloidogyne graminicola]